MHLDKQANCMKMIKQYEDSVQNQYKLNQSVDEFFSTDKRFYDCIESMVKQYCTKIGDQYTGLKPNTEICQNGKNLSDIERRELENFLKPFMQLVNHGNPFSNIPGSNDDKVQLIADVLKSNPTYLRDIQACSDQMNTGGYQHADKLIPVQKPSSVIALEATRTTAGFKSSTEMKLDNITIMAVQRGIQMPNLCQEIQKYAERVGNINIRDNAKSAFKVLTEQSAIQNVRLAEANLQNVLASEERNATKISDAQKVLAESLDALGKASGEANLSTGMPKVPTRGQAARAATNTSTHGNLKLEKIAKTLYQQSNSRDSKPNQVVSNDPEIRRKNATDEDRLKAKANRTLTQAETMNKRTEVDVFKESAPSGNTPGRKRH